jgi:putative redox protein
MKAKVSWAGDVKFVGTTGSGHEVTMDGPPDSGGKDQGPRPMEMLLLGLGACSSVDVVGVLKKSRQDVEDVYVDIDAERAASVPAVFTKIHLKFVVSGKDLKESIVKRAVSLSAEKYCSASIMLGEAGVEMSHSYQIVEI